ncbi:histone deacetylase [Parafrankia sp. FMc6]|uniref:histone deacetylase n=1 Tax=Parafrankia soli TaxID=2599596 RepID=UPI0034D672C4
MGRAWTSAGRRAVVEEAEVAVDRAGTPLVWYVSYGSNLRSSRLAYYLAGGTMPGTTHVYPGCRDRRPPRATAPLLLPGSVYFALESKVWGGGMAFYDPAVPGLAAARAYLLSRQQFVDIAAQEMHREPGGDLDLTALLGAGRAVLGPGRYETVLLVGHWGPVPLLTFTAPWGLADVALTAPSGAYLDMLAAGLREGNGWPPARIAAYLAGLPGAHGVWQPDEIAGRLTAADVTESAG